MDKSWIEKPRHTHEYLVGLNRFLDFAFTNAEVGGRIKSPCPLCKFAYWQTRDVAFNHLICKQFPQNYITWTIHGERNVLPTSRDVEEKLELALSQSTVDESQASPNDDVGKVLGKKHPGRVRCMGLGATPSIAFKQTNRRVSSMRFPSNDVCSSSECQVKYNQLLNTLKAYMIIKEWSIPEQFTGIFDSTLTTPHDAASGPVSPVNARRSVSASNSSDDPFN